MTTLPTNTGTATEPRSRPARAAHSSLQTDRSALVPVVPPGATIARSVLKEALAEVAKVVGKSSLPILLHVRIDATDSTLTLTTTNLECAIRRSVAAHTQAPFSTTLSARLLSDVVGALPDGDVQFSFDATTETTTLTAGAFITNLKGIPATEFPSIPLPSADCRAITLPGHVLAEAIELTALAAATDDTRPVLTGLSIRIQPQHCIFAAADGHRAARKVVVLDHTHPPCAVLPQAHALALLAPLFVEEAAVTLTLAPAGNILCLCSPGREASIRLLDLRFPDIDRVIDAALEEPLCTMEVSSTDIRRALKLARLFTDSHAIRCDATQPDSLHVVANESESGNQRAAITATIEGAASFALNASFAATAVEAVSRACKGSAMLRISLRSPNHAIVFRPIDDERYVHVVMPMTVR